MLERDDFQRIAQKTLTDIVAAPPKSHEAWQYCVRTSSGTSGGRSIGLVVKYPREALDRFNSVAAPLICIGSMTARLAFVLQARYGTPEGARTFAVDGTDLGESLRNDIRSFAPDSIFGFVSFIVRVAEYIDDDVARGVTWLLLSGEYITESTERYLRGKFPNARISARYITVEVGRITQESCEFQPRNHYHPYEGVTVEIDGTDEGGIGDVVVSTRAHGVDIARYRTGDIGRMHSGVCRCGANVTFELLGRKGLDYVKLAGAILRREEFDRVANEISLFDDYRAEASDALVGGKLKGKVVLKIYRASGPLSPSDLRDVPRRFAENLFVTPSRTYADLVSDGIMEPLVVEVMATPFPEVHKQIKVRRADS